MIYRLLLLYNKNSLLVREFRNMDIAMQICGTAILIVLLVLFSTKRDKLFLNTEKMYIIILIVA